MATQSLKAVTKETTIVESLPEFEARIRLEEQKQVYELKEKEATAQQQRFLEKVKTLTSLMIMIVIAGTYLYVTLSNRFSQEEKKQASNILYTFVVAIFSYLAGKAIGKKELSQ